MNGRTRELWATLQDAGIVSGEAPRTTAADSPWFVKLLLGFSGWLAAIFLFAFIGTGFSFVFESGTASLVIGGFMIAAAFVVLRVERNEFLEHLALAVSLAGQALVILAIVHFNEPNDTPIWLLTAVFEALLSLVMPNFVHRVFTTFVAAGALGMGLSSLDMPFGVAALFMLLAAVLWLNEFRWPQHVRKLQAIGYGLVLALVWHKGMTHFGWRLTTGGGVPLIPVSVDEIVSGAVLVGVVWTLLRRQGIGLADKYAFAALAGALLLAVASLEARGLTAGIMIVLLGFAAGNYVLLGIGIVALLFFVSSYYYLLDITLLAKSQSLLVIGVLLLALRWILGQVLTRREETADG